MNRPLVVWDPRMLGYDLGGKHPMHPLRWELTWLLAGTLGVIDGFHVLSPEPADVATLGLVHTLGYIDAVRRASRPGFLFSVGHGLGTPDNPVFPGMHQSAALIAGGSVTAARAIAHREVDRAVNFCGGLHHAMADSASGFCVYNDAALAIAAMLEAGVRRVAYVDADVHHADGVQAAFYDDPRVLTVSIHQAPLTLFPGTGRKRMRGWRGGRYVGQRRSAGRHRGRGLVAGVPRGRARRGAGVRSGGAGHPARRGHPTGRTRWPT